MKIQMFHRIEGMTNIFPPVMGNEYMPEWVETAREQFNNLPEKEKVDKFSVLKCPGIFELFSKGFYVPLPYSVDLQVKDEKNLSYSHSSFDPKNIPADIYDETKGYFADIMKVVIHDAYGVAEHLPFKEGQFKGIINLKTGWTIVSPVPVMFLPVPYADNTDYEGSIGILDTRKNGNVNAQLYLNAKKCTINAGDHVMFIVPMTDQKWELDVREMTKKDKMFLSAVHLLQSGWTRLQSFNFPRYSSCPFDLKQKQFKLWEKFWKK